MRNIAGEAAAKARTPAKILKRGAAVMTIIAIAHEAIQKRVATEGMIDRGSEGSCSDRTADDWSVSTSTPTAIASEPTRAPLELRSDRR